MATALIDIVGHFGTTFSYATVGSEVAAALRAHELLGTVHNLDSEWHPTNNHLASSRGAGTHVILFTSPDHYIEPFARQYGRSRSALFMSPNTNALAPEHVRTARAFGLLVVPSAWCQKTVYTSLATTDLVDLDVACLPLGVPSGLAQRRPERTARLRGRLHDRPRALHLSTDQTWPGRKGTEELIVAWASLPRPRPALTLHVPFALQRHCMLMCADVNLPDVEVTGPPRKGSSRQEIVELYDNYDMAILPSRSEGFGMMMLAALVAGVPLVSTYNTGHADFMGVAGGWLGVPSPTMDVLAYEHGDAPTVDVHSLTLTLAAAVTQEARASMLGSSARFFTELGDQGASWGTWKMAGEQWVDRLREWTEETG